MYSLCPTPSSRREIKVVVSGGLGDCLLASPFVRHFWKAGIYGKIICVFPKPALEIFDCNPYIDQLIPCSGRDLFLWAIPETDCDVFSPYVSVLAPEKLCPNTEILASPHFRANLEVRPVVQQVAEYHGLQIQDDTLEIYTTLEDAAWADEYARQWKGALAVFLNTVSQHSEKDLPPSASQPLVDRLRKDFVVLEFSNGKTTHRGTVPISPMIGIRRSAELFKRQSCIITVDSFPGHLAWAVKAPAVVLFGPSNPLAFGHSANFNIRTSRCPPCADTVRKAQCVNPFCVAEIPLETILKAVEQAVGKRGSLEPPGLSGPREKTVVQISSSEHPGE